MKYLISVDWVLSVVTKGAIQLSVFGRVAKTLLQNRNQSCNINLVFKRLKYSIEFLDSALLQFRLNFGIDVI